MANTTIPSELIQADVALGGSPTTTTQSAGNNTTKLATTAFVTAAVNALVDSAPGTMNTLNEIAAALNDDASFNTTVTNAIATKLPLGGGTMTGNITVNDNVEIQFGTGGDYKFDYNGSRLNVIGTGDAVLDISGNFYFDADGGKWVFQDGGTLRMELENSSGNMLLYNGTNNGDFQFKGRDGSSVITALTLDMSDAGTAVFNHDIKIPASGQIIGAGELSFDAASDNFIFTRDGGNGRGQLQANNDDFSMKCTLNNGDILFKGVDGGAAITALTLDMSAAGLATFNAGITATSLRIGNTGSFGDVSGNDLVIGNNSGSHGLTIHSAAANTSSIFFGNDGTNGNIDGSLQYFHESFGTATLRRSLVFKTAGDNKRMIINSAGDVLIGQASQTGYTFAEKLVVGDGDNNDGITIQSGGTHQGNLAFNHSDGTTAHGRISYQHSTNFMAFFTNNVERVRITSAGDVNIGGTSSGGVPKVNFYHNDSLRAFIQATSAAGMLLDSDGKMTFNTNNAAKWHIQSSGHLTPNNQHSFDIGGVNAEVRNIYAQQLLIGKSASNVAAAGLYVAPNDFMAYTNTGTDDGDRCLVLNRQNSNGLILDFKVGNSLKGSVSFNGSVLNYGGSSDYRLKENIKPMQNGLDRLNKLNPVSFDWKESGIKSEGFIAHEVQEVFPEVVVGKKDGKEMQQMDYGRISPLLVKAIQEQQTLIESLTARIEELEG